MLLRKNCLMGTFMMVVTSIKNILYLKDTSLVILVSVLEKFRGMVLSVPNYHFLVNG